MSKFVDKVVLSMVFLFTLISLTKLNPRNYALIFVFLFLTIILAFIKRRLSGGKFEIHKENT